MRLEINKAGFHSTKQYGEVCARKRHNGFCVNLLIPLFKFCSPWSFCRQYLGYQWCIISILRVVPAIHGINALSVVLMEWVGKFTQISIIAFYIFQYIP